MPRYLIVGLALLLTACSPPESAIEIEFAGSPDRTWIGPQFYANRMLDWELRDGRLQGRADKPMRTVHLLTRYLNAEPGSLVMSVITGPVNQPDAVNDSTWTGFLIGAGGDEIDYRISSLVHDWPGPGGGLFVGVDGSGHIIVRDNENPDDWPLITPLETHGIVGNFNRFGIRVLATSTEGRYSMVVEVFDPDTDEVQSHAVYLDIAPEYFSGNVALVSHRSPSSEGAGYWFDKWKLQGSKVEKDESRAIGPVLDTQYTLSGGILKMTAQMGPLGADDSKVASLQIQQAGSWKTVASGELNATAYTIGFSVEDWTETQDVAFRVMYSLWEGAAVVTHYYEGTIHAGAAAQDVENVFFITMDGLRWEELFTGADPWLLNNEQYTSGREALSQKYWREDPRERRRALMPFFWSEIAENGQLHGNRMLGSNVNVSNTRLFSYPGYNEILTGFADDSIDSNDKKPNRNVTVLEWINNLSDFKGKVAAFGSWDVFPFIINEERSRVPVNAGFEDARGEVSEKEAWLNEIQSQTPSPWTTVRLDVFTHHYAIEYIKRQRPRVVYIAYGETDDFAHDGQYDQYLNAAHRTDAFISELWNLVQADDYYRNRTAFVITTDHGRGEKDRWVGHGADWIGSENIWVALLGPGIEGLGEMKGGIQLFQNQVASTVAQLLGLRYENRVPVGESILGKQR